MLCVFVNSSCSVHRCHFFSNNWHPPYVTSQPVLCPNSFNNLRSACALRLVVQFHLTGLSTVGARDQSKHLPSTSLCRTSASIASNKRSFDHTWTIATSLAQNLKKVQESCYNNLAVPPRSNMFICYRSKITDTHVQRTEAHVT